MIYQEIREKDFEPKLVDKFINDLFTSHKTKVTRENFSESYQSLCVIIFMEVLGQKITQRLVSEFSKRFDFYLFQIDFPETAKIIKKINLSVENLGNFFDILHQYYLSNKFESSISLRSKLSSYYTPKIISDLIVNQTYYQNIRLRKAPYSIKILDPCCGTGIFISSILGAANERKLDPKKVLKNPFATDGQPSISGVEMSGISFSQS
mgnify:CR=1 FL=1